MNEAAARDDSHGEGAIEVESFPAPIDVSEVFARAAAQHDGVALAIFRPRAGVSVGREQAIAREVRLSWCRARGLPIRRRPTGGGALWHDPGQAAFCLAAPADLLGADAAERLASGGAVLLAALAGLGIDAAFVAPNDVEVAGGAKIGSVFLAEDGDRALLFATLLVRFDVAAALSALLVPTEKLTRTGLEHARERVATLADLCVPPPDEATVAAALVDAVAARLGLATRPSTRTRVEDDERESDDGDGRDSWEAPIDDGFETLERTARATLRLRLRFTEPGGRRIAEARFATDAAHLPAGLAERLATAAVDVDLDDLPAVVAGVTAAGEAAVGFTRADLVRLARRAVEKARLAAGVGLDPAATSAVMLAGPGGDALDALERASVVLVPYCAKPAWCALRPTPDCIDCGHCAVGDAYRLARERGLEVTTILDFEHLGTTLAEMKARGVTAYVGMCCSDFFRKRHVAFREAGMDAVLMDIVGATCYDLKEEHLAYAGAFKAEAALDLDTLEKVMARVPVHAAGEG